MDIHSRRSTGFCATRQDSQRFKLSFSCSASKPAELDSSNLSSNSNVSNPVYRSIVSNPFAARIRRWRSTRFLPSSSQIRIVARYQSVPPFLFRHCTAVCSAYSDLPLPLPPVTIYNIVHLSSFSLNCSSFHALKTYAKNVLIRISHHTSGLYSSISISANVSISR